MYCIQCITDIDIYVDSELYFRFLFFSRENERKKEQSKSLVNATLNANNAKSLVTRAVNLVNKIKIVDLPFRSDGWQFLSFRKSITISRTEGQRLFLLLKIIDTYRFFKRELQYSQDLLVDVGMFENFILRIKHISFIWKTSSILTLRSIIESSNRLEKLLFYFILSYHCFSN